MPEYEKIEELTESLKNYVSTNCELLKLQAAERSSVIGSGLLSRLVLAIIGFLFILFVSLGIGFYVSAKLDDSYSGFVIVAGFYFLVWMIILIGRKSLLEKPLRDKIIKMFYNN